MIASQVPGDWQTSTPLVPLWNGDILQCLADPGESRACSENTVVNSLLTGFNDWKFTFLSKIYFSYLLQKQYDIFIKDFFSFSSFKNVTLIAIEGTIR